MPLGKKQLQIYYASLQVELEKFFEKFESAKEQLDPNCGQLRKAFFERVTDYFFITEKLKGNKYAR